jgi:hypothetical protein
MGNNLPCFSIMTEAELFAWSWKHRDGSRAVATEVFPGRPKGYTGIVQDMSRLANALARAKRAHRNNRKKEAEGYEEEAARIRAELPDFARPA